MSMADEVFEILDAELSKEDEYNANILLGKIDSVIKELRLRRNYSATSLSDDDIEKDMENYFSVVLDVARYDYNQRGVEGQSAHSDNGVSRTWISRNAIWNPVHAFVKVL